MLCGGIEFLADLEPFVFPIFCGRFRALAQRIHFVGAQWLERQRGLNRLFKSFPTVDARDHGRNRQTETVMQAFYRRRLSAPRNFTTA